MKADAVATLEPPGLSWHNLVRHFVEMVVAMIAGMAILGGLLSLSFALVGHATPVHYAGLRALVMTINMTVGMSLWMRHRHHGWRSISEMAGAMFLPLIVLIGPYWAGLLPGGALLSAMHVLMLPCMLAAMLHRREEYAQDHLRHSTSQPSLVQGLRAA